jgi:mutual gliding-motility protein MglA
MAFYSASTKTVTLRIVYDGLGTAGKTTNVQQLHDLNTLRREGPVTAPEVIGGRTAYFDWLELTVGLLDDRHPLRCQVLTVPGQFAYAPRRWKLLQQPDAIVCVCDSSRSALRRGRLGMDFLREIRDRGLCTDAPIVIQANKRDAPDAVSLSELRSELALTAEQTVVEAIARSGEGVQLTFYHALEAARARLRTLLERDGVAGLPSPQTPDQLLAELRDELPSEQDEAYALVESLTARSER